MEKIIWTLDDIRRFAHDPDAALRDWAVERLLGLFPDQAAEILAALLDDTRFFIVQRAAEFLGRSGDRERYGPALLERLTRAAGPSFDPIALALARLDYREALPVLLERLEYLAQAFPTEWGTGHYGLFHALGIYGGREVRQALWRVLGIFPRDELSRPSAITAMLEAALPADVARLVALYRSREAGGDRRRYLDALAGAAEVADLALELEEEVPIGLVAVLNAASEWLGDLPAWSGRFLAELEQSFRRKQQGIFGTLLAEAQRMSAERGDDIAGWRLAWDTGIRPRGYQRRALLTLLILEALAVHGHPYPKLRDYESALGLALLAQYSVDRDDQPWLERAEDRAAALLDILLSDREHVSPDVIEQVAALGPSVLPRLIAALDPADETWGSIRAVRAIERLARRCPGSCDAAAPALVAMIDDEQGDFILEACADALAAIGPAAVPAIGQHLRDDDISRQIYLTGALEEIPTEGAARLILDVVADTASCDETQLLALRGIGSRAAIEPLYQLWQAGDDDPQLAETLFVLCQLHGEDRPELAEWRTIVEEQDARMDALIGKSFSEIVMERAAAHREEPLPAAGAAARPKHKGIGSKERRKRAAQRRDQRRKKKGKR